MKRTKLFLGLLIILFSINLVFAAVSWCNDTDAKEKAGVYPRGINYYQNGVNSGENKLGSWNQQDFCKGNQLYEFYCYYSNKQYYNGTAIYKCPKGCNSELKACNPRTSVTGKAIDLSITSSSTSTYLGIGILIIVIAIIVWFLLRKKKKKKR